MKRLSQVFFDRPFAHRALHDLSRGRPENSIAAIDAAVHHGFGVEIDLQLSRDDKALVFHDYNLDRLTDETGNVRERDLIDLKRIRLTGGHDTIPDFEKVLSHLAGQVPLLVELKDQHGQLGKTDGQLELAVAQQLRKYDGPVGVMSFNPEMVALLADLLPEVPRGLVTCAYPALNWPKVPEEVRARLREIPDYDRVDASFISHQSDDLKRPRVAELKERGAAIFCWTIRSPKQEAQARKIADNVTFEGYLSAYNT